jgi:hypothetical protein
MQFVEGIRDRRGHFILLVYPGGVFREAAGRPGMPTPTISRGRGYMDGKMMLGFGTLP